MIFQNYKKEKITFNIKNKLIKCIQKNQLKGKASFKFHYIQIMIKQAQYIQKINTQNIIQNSSYK